MKQGKLYGVGVGPGDPELMTLKAVRVIKACDVIFLPAVEKEKCHAYKIAEQVVPDIHEKEIVCYEFPMTKDTEKLKQAHEMVAVRLMEELDQGKGAAMLTIGDPGIYSTYSYIQAILQEKGYETETISGVPSFCAAAARLNIPLASASEAIHIISGNQPGGLSLTDQEQEDIGKIDTATRIYMKSGKQLRGLLEELRMESLTRKLSIYIVSNCGMENEQIRIWTGEDLNLSENIDKITESGYLTIVIVKIDQKL